MTEDASALARLRLIDPATAPQPIAEMFKLLPDISLFRVMANGGRSACDYAWRANALVAKVVGVKNEQLEAIQNSAVAASCFAPAEIATFRFAEEAMDLIEATDTTFGRAKRFFSDRAIVEILYVVGAYMFVARVAHRARSA